MKQEAIVKKTATEITSDIRMANAIWGPLSKRARAALKELISCHGLSVAGGDVQLLDDKWYVTHTGLIRLAQRKHCAGINVRQVRDFCDLAIPRWVFRATVHRKLGSKGFVGYGDADPSNVSPLVRGAEMRVAETCPRSPVFESNDFRGATPGVWRLVETTTVNQIEAGHFNPHSGIRFPQNGCMSCPHLGLCLNNEQLVADNLIRKPGASNLDWLDELVD